MRKKKYFPYNSREKLKTQEKNSITQGKNSRFRQIHLVELSKTGPISKPAVRRPCLNFHNTTRFNETHSIEIS